MKIIESDIFNGEWNGMVHCANLYHVMGSGIAKEIKQRYPEVYEADCSTKYFDEKKLGTFSYAEISQDETHTIFNLYGQVGIGNDGHSLNRNARYDAIHDGVWRICEFISKEYFYIKKYSLAFPYKMASDRAGGDFLIVQAILESVQSNFLNIEFVIYRKK
jgi:hypothetical protein